MKISQKAILELYKSMLKIRLTEETIAQKYSEWEVRCPTHLSIGQEAVASGVCAALNENDFVLSTHRSHGHYIAKGGDLNRMIAEMYGKATGCSAGKGGSMHLIDKTVGFMGSTAIVGNTIPLAVGLGLSIHLKDSSNISCVFFGDGAVEEGAFYESINFAVLKQLPLLFVCENNLYSVYSPLRVRQPVSRKIYEMANAFGICSKKGNGNDVSDVYGLAKEAVSNIKSGKGPQFIEFETYRWREHCGPNYDNDLGYRTEAEYLDWKKRDPITQCEESLLDLNCKETASIKKNVQKTVNEAFDFAKHSHFPESEEAFIHLYAN